MRKILAVALLLASGAAFGDDTIDRIWNNAKIHAGNKELLEADRQEAAALLATNPSSGYYHYLMGHVLEANGDFSGAVDEYRRAAELAGSDNGLNSDAHYNAGVVLSDHGDKQRAAEEWMAALRANPKSGDAAYNLGMNQYLQERYGEALENWRTVQGLDPNDYQVARKITQALNALGRWDEAATAREHVLQLHRDSTDPAVSGAKNWVYDQMKLSTGRVYAYETFSPAAGASPWTFKVADAGDTSIGEIELVPQGTGWVLTVTSPAGKAPGKAYATLPAWRELRPVVAALAQARFIDSPAAPAAPTAPAAPAKKKKK